MGILDNFAKRVADQITKASPIATPISEAQISQALNQYGTSVGLPRNPFLGDVPFTPGVPIVPGAINNLRADGRPDPRRYEYQVAQNINITETRLVPFKTLRSAADQIDIIRRCVEVMKHKVVGLEWDIVLAPDAAEKVMAETGEKTYTRAMEMAKAKYSDEINRARKFWEVPDLSNGMVFTDWLNMAAEEILVLDAWAIWPQMNVKGDLLGLQILDGSTIKPLIDDRGMRPLPPYPAFQQILYGFPRSEFSAATEETEADGEFSSDELSYLVRNRRTNTMYGYSPVERSLALADIYLRRQQWIRAEYTDGVIPELILKSDGVFTPDQLKAYENVLNDYLSGMTENRKRASILPQGLDPIQLEGYGEKFKDTLDDYLVTAICGHFGVQPSEIGMNSKSGLGGSGIQQGEANSSEVIGLVPMANWVGKMISQLSYVYLGMPRELEFKFMPSDRNDGEALAREFDIRAKNGSLSINEMRSKSGEPLLSAPEADQPLIVTPAGTFFITDEGLKPVGGDLSAGLETPEAPKPEVSAPATEKPALEAPAAAEPVETDEAAAEKAIKKEIGQFVRWLRKSPTNTFDFTVVPTVYGETLNKFVEAQDFDGARWYAERYLA
jgi:hypothetical protein